ncbi:putative Protein LST8 [Paratrimastix pyriformis]|uniref:Target of rapamycin complex subunit LST8 n=1 Tax=Paratrimastix pyriformis TaxID=342808 RepID=A0ABQ8UTC4_9EUKA|nr:putative Protein LST8 [Paratrimastix pyriformis]
MALIATSGYDHTIRFWEPTNGICYRSFQYMDSHVNRLEITPDKRYIAAAGNPRISFFDLTSSGQHAISNYDGHTNNVVEIGFQREQRWFFSGSEDGLVKVWDFREKQAKRAYKSSDPVTAVVLHPSQMELIAGYQNGAIRIWDLNSADSCVFETTPMPNVAVRSLTVSRDGSMLIAATSKGRCFVYNLSTARSDVPSPSRLELQHSFPAHDTYILKCLLSPNGRLLATCSADHTVKIWNANDFALEKTLMAHTQWVWDCVFTIDSAYLVTASSDRKAMLWELGSARPVKTYTGHHKPVVCVAMNDTSVPPAPGPTPFPQAEQGPRSAMPQQQAQPPPPTSSVAPAPVRPTRHTMTAAPAPYMQQPQPQAQPQAQPQGS